MKRLAAALLLVASSAAADPVAGDAIGVIDRTEPARELKRLEKGTQEERARVIARAAASARDRDEAVALLVAAAERARHLELRDPELIAIARGLAQRGPTKAARDGLFALLVTPPREGLDGQAPHQRIAATALARAAEYRDPPPPGGKLEVVKAQPDTLGKLLELAEEARTEELVTQALLRYPPLHAPRTVGGPAFFRIGARLGDLRWIPAVERALQDRGQPRQEPRTVAALYAAAELGDSRVLPQVRALASHPSVALSVAALNAWIRLEPEPARTAIERALGRSGAPPAYYELARFVREPALLQTIATRLAGAEPAAMGESIRLLGTLPGGAGVAILAKLAGQDRHLVPAAAALAATRGDAAGAALETLLGDARAPVRHEAAFALLSRALGTDAEARAARAALAAAERRGVALPKPVRAWLAGSKTPRQRAAETWSASVREGTSRSRGALAECARALRMESPACAYAFGKSVPQTLDDASRSELASLLEIADPSVRAELLAGLLAGAWPGRYAALARALERATDLPLRRRLAGLASPLAGEHRAAREALGPTLQAMLWAEPDLLTWRLLQGPAQSAAPTVYLVRADADGQVRCGYARDAFGAVTPLVVEDGGALVLGRGGSTFEVTFTRCDESVLSRAALR